MARLLSPQNWNALWSEGWGRSEMAAELYDEVLFEGATFADLEKKPGPMIMATATDISTGSRLGFTQGEFDLICSDLSTGAAVARGRRVVRRAARAVAGHAQQLRRHVRLSRARAGRARLPIRTVARDRRDARCSGCARCGRSRTASTGRTSISSTAASRTTSACAWSSRPWRRSKPIARAGRASRSDQIKRIVVVVVNSLSIPKTDWDQRARPPSDFVILLKATGVPIDRYSYEAVELLKDIIARWQTLRTLKESGAFANAGNPALGRAVGVPDIDLYAIDVSFASHPSQSERDYLNELPTSFRLDAARRSTICARRRVRSCVRRPSISG